MIDPLGSAVWAMTSRSPAALALVFVTGLATSAGPCIAPRYVAVAAIAGGGRRSIAPIAAFICGLIAALLALGFSAGALGALWSYSTAVYGLLALSLICCGTIMLVRAGPDAAHSTCDGHNVEPRHNRSFGAIFLLGAASAFVVSPCCTPIVVAIVSTATAIGQPVVGAELLLTYALGHTLPLMFAGSLGPIVRRLGSNRIGTQAPAIVGAVLMLGLGLYYAVLA